MRSYRNNLALALLALVATLAPYAPLEGGRVMLMGVWGMRKKTSEPVVEYIETDGACFFDTGVYLRTPLKVECDFYIPERGAGSTVWGSYRQSAINCRQITGNSSIYKECTVSYNGTNALGRSWEKPIYPYRANMTYEADAGSQTLSVFGATFSTSNANGLGDTLNCTCGLFGGGRTGNYPQGDQWCKLGVRIYSWRCWIGGSLVADIWPSLGEDGQTPCFHDTVSGDYLYNKGTGTPTAVLAQS